MDYKLNYHDLKDVDFFGDHVKLPIKEEEKKEKKKIEIT